MLGMFQNVQKPNLEGSLNLELKKTSPPHPHAKLQYKSQHMK
jgi:hypothetical protein